MSIVEKTLAEAEPWLSVVGVGESGWDGLSAEARQAIETADLIIGGERHLALVPTEGKETKVWGKRLKTLVDEVANLRGRNVCVLASGDPLFYGVGSHFARVLGTDDLKIIPNLSILSYVCARMLWSQPDVRLVTLCGRPQELLHPELFDGGRLVVLCAGRDTPREVAALMTARGFGESVIHVFDYVGGEREQRHSYKAADVGADIIFSDLNTLAVECRAGADASVFSKSPGLPDDAFEHDGQITKSEVRAVTLARLSPRPGELLWDIGAGSGSIGVEWMRAAFEAKTIAIEAREDRAERVKRNAFALGVPRLDVRLGEAPGILEGLPHPDAIFIGGGLTVPGVIDFCWEKLKPGGRLVANAVTLESEAILLNVHAEIGGDLTRLSVQRAAPLGRFEGWHSAMPVTQWAISKPYLDVDLG